LLVEHDFLPTLGAPVCGDAAALGTVTDGAILLRNLVCEVGREELFHHILTPNYDAAHADHFHLDIKRGARELVVR
jgi:hypothetical protein